MRILIVSDIHANLAALEAVLADAGAVDGVWCLGDTVGYGPQPAECIARLREFVPAWVAGNHERAATGAISTEDFNPDAATAAEWTKRTLSEDDRGRLDMLPEVVGEGEFTLVHGTLRYPIWEYLYAEDIALAHLELQKTPFSLVGHTHIPTLGWLDPAQPNDAPLHRMEHREQVELNTERRWVMNPGSVGQPRDRDPRASYAVYDSETQSVSWQRVEYDIAATQKLMAEAGLPAWLIQRLSAGR